MNNQDNNYFTKISPQHYIYNDTCTVYIIKNNDKAVLINCGSGDVFQYLHLLGITKVEKIFITNHHRDVCGGINNKPEESTVYFSEYEQDLFKEVEQFWQNKKIYNQYTVEQVYFSRTKNIECTLVKENDQIEWEGNNFTIIFTPSDSSGAISVLWNDENNNTFIYCGDMIKSFGKVQNIYEYQWRYMPSDRIFEEWTQSLQKILNLEFDQLCPAHGLPMKNGKDAIDQLLLNIYSLQNMLAPERIPNLRKPLSKVLPHLIYVDHSAYLLLSETGHGIIIDYGYVDQQLYQRLKNEFGLKHIDVLTFTHYHDDHLSRSSELKYRFATPTNSMYEEIEVWNLASNADIMKNSSAYNLPCLFPSSIETDRIIKDDEHVKWNEYDIHFFHFPGQTYYNMGICVQVDGETVVFSGDNTWHTVDHNIITPIIFKNVVHPEHLVQAAERIEQINPTMLATGHNDVFKVNQHILQNYTRWTKRLKNQLYSLVDQDHPLYGIDCKWAYVYPYVSEVVSGDQLKIWVRVKNHYTHPAEFRIALKVPENFTVHNNDQRVKVDAQQVKDVPFIIDTPEQLLPNQRNVSTVEIERNNINCGEFTEFIIKTKHNISFA